MIDLGDRVDTGFTQICSTFDATGPVPIVDLLANLIGDRPAGTSAGR